MEIIDRLLNIANVIANIYKEISCCAYKKNTKKLKKLKKDLNLCLEIEEEIMRNLDFNKMDECVSYLCKKSSNIYFYEHFKCLVHNQSFDSVLRVFKKINYYYNKSALFIDFHTKKIPNSMENSYSFLCDLYFEEIFLDVLNRNKSENLEYYKMLYKVSYYNPVIESNIGNKNFKPKTITENILEYIGTDSYEFDLYNSESVYMFIYQYLSYIQKLPKKYFKSDFQKEKICHRILIKYFFVILGNSFEQVDVMNNLLKESKFNEEYYCFIENLIGEMAFLENEEQLLEDLCYNQVKM